MIKIVLLKSFQALGKVGQVVSAKRGYAVNFLIPNQIALIANEAVMKKITKQTEELKKSDEIMRKDANSLLATLEGKKIVVIKSCSEDGTLYGSIGSKDIFSELEKLSPQISKFVTKSSIRIPSAIKQIGKFKGTINIYDNIEFKTDIIVARSAEEANSIISPSSEKKLEDLNSGI